MQNALRVTTPSDISFSGHDIRISLGLWPREIPTTCPPREISHWVITLGESSYDVYVRKTDKTTIYTPVAQDSLVVSLKLPLLDERFAPFHQYLRYSYTSDTGDFSRRSAIRWIQFHIGSMVFAKISPAKHAIYSSDGLHRSARHLSNTQHVQISPLCWNYY